MFKIEINRREKADGSVEYFNSGSLINCSIELYRDRLNNRYILKDNGDSWLLSYSSPIFGIGLTWDYSRYYGNIEPYQKIDLMKLGIYEGDILEEGIIYLYLIYRFADESIPFTKLFSAGSCGMKIRSEFSGRNKNIYYYDSFTSDRLKISINYTYDTFFCISGEMTIDSSNFPKNSTDNSTSISLDEIGHGYYKYDKKDSRPRIIDLGDVKLDLDKMVAYQKKLDEEKRKKEEARGPFINFLIKYLIPFVIIAIVSYIYSYFKG